MVALVKKIHIQEEHGHIFYYFEVSTTFGWAYPSSLFEGFLKWDILLQG